ncbi:H(+)-transporting V1 sector ATPase subunit G [Chytridiales sp. JEL 0842]|nr:H(+)-transporting V1 sector ATPase subunit G [Chytridiales sp. JEL 0842]
MQHKRIALERFLHKYESLDEHQRIAISRDTLKAASHASNVEYIQKLFNDLKQDPTFNAEKELIDAYRDRIASVKEFIDSFQEKENVKVDEPSMKAEKNVAPKPVFWERSRLKSSHGANRLVNGSDLLTTTSTTTASARDGLAHSHDGPRKRTNATEVSSENEKLLQEQKEAQERYSEELVRLAQTLKESSIQFGSSLKKDSEVVNEAQNALETNYSKLTKEGSRLKTISVRARGTCFMVWGSVLLASNQGIQTLLEAEKDASKIVTKARQYRVQRLKDARTEAAKEIEVLKAEKQKEFLEYEKQYVGNTDDSYAKVNQETDQKLVEINEAFKTNQDLVFRKLLEAVVNVDPKVHINAKV